MTKRPRVVRLIARLNMGGPAKHVAWLEAGLRSSFDSTLLVGEVPDGETDLSGFAADRGVRPVRIPGLSREISWRDLIAVFLVWRRLVSLNPDIVHTHTAKAGLVGRLAVLLYRYATPSMLLGKPRRCRVCHTYHGHVFHGYFSSWKTKVFLWIERLLSCVTDKIIVLSRQQRQEIHESFGIGKAAQFEIIPLGIDLSELSNPESDGRRFRREFGFDEDAFVVGIVGRICEIKDHDLFLRSVAALKNSIVSPEKKIQYAIVGDGPLRARLSAWCDEHNLSEVVFTGSRNDPAEFYAALDAVVLTSKNEGTPLSLIEAMAVGRPVVSTAVGGVGDLLGERLTPELNAPYDVHERGLGISDRSANAIAMAISHLVSDDLLQHRLVQSGRDYVSRRHSHHRLVADVSNLYRDLLATDVGGAQQQPSSSKADATIQSA